MIDLNIECPVCLEEMNNSRILPCGHSFCTICLDKLFKNTTIICPLCSCKIKIDNIYKLPRNYTLDNLINMIKKNNNTLLPPLIKSGNNDDNNNKINENDDENIRLSNCQRICYGCCITHFHRDNDKL